MFKIEAHGKLKLEISKIQDVISKIRDVILLPRPQACVTMFGCPILVLVLYVPH